MNKLSLVFSLLVGFIMGCSAKSELANESMVLKKDVEDSNKVEFLGINIWEDSSCVIFDNYTLNENKYFFSVDYNAKELKQLKSTVSITDPNIYFERLNLPYDFELTPKSIINFNEPISLGAYVFISDEIPLSFTIDHYTKIPDNKISSQLDINDFSYGLELIKVSLDNYELFDCKYVNTYDQVTRIILIKTNTGNYKRMKLF